MIARIKTVGETADEVEIFAVPAGGSQFSTWPADCPEEREIRSSQRGSAGLRESRPDFSLQLL